MQSDAVAAAAASPPPPRLGDPPRPKPATTSRVKEAAAEATDGTPAAEHSTPAPSAPAAHLVALMSGRTPPIPPTPPTTPNTPTDSSNHRFEFRTFGHVMSRVANGADQRARRASPAARRRTASHARHRSLDMMMQSATGQADGDGNGGDKLGRPELPALLIECDGESDGERDGDESSPRDCVGSSTATPTHAATPRPSLLVGEGQLTFSDAFSALAWTQSLQLGSPVTDDLTMAAGTSRALYGTPAAGSSSSSLHLPSPQSAPAHPHGSSSLQWQTPEQAGASSGAAGGSPGPRDRSYLAATVLFLKQRNRLLSSQRESAERDRASALNCVHMLQKENAELKERLAAFTDMTSQPRPTRVSGSGPVSKETCPDRSFYEEQLSLADENLMQAKEVWQSTSAILQQQIAALEQRVLEVTAECAQVRLALSQQVDVTERIQSAAERKAHRLESMLDRCQIELTAARMREQMGHQWTNEGSAGSVSVNSDAPAEEGPAARQPNAQLSAHLTSRACGGHLSGDSSDSSEPLPVGDSGPQSPAHAHPPRSQSPPSRSHAQSPGVVGRERAPRFHGHEQACGAQLHSTTVDTLDVDTDSDSDVLEDAESTPSRTPPRA